MSDGPIVYVVDDDPSFRKAVSRLLRTAGLEVETLASAQEFLDHPMVDRPSCLVLDVRMPGPSGIDLQPFRAAELLACVQRGLARSRQSRAERAERTTVERRFATLTPRERDVLRLVVTGLLNKQIAGERGIAEKTVKIHRGQVMQKMEAGSVAELVPMAQKLGLTGSPPAPAH